MNTSTNVVAANLAVSAKPEHPWLILLGFVLLAVLHRVVQPDPLSDIPGPWLARHTSLLLGYYTRTGKRYMYINNLHKVRPYTSPISQPNPLPRNTVPSSVSLPPRSPALTPMTRQPSTPKAQPPFPKHPSTAPFTLTEHPPYSAPKIAPDIPPNDASSPTHSATPPSSSSRDGSARA